MWKPLRRWCRSASGPLLQALADGGGTLDMLQMIDSTIVRAHRSARRRKGQSKIRHSVVRAVGAAPRSMCVATPAGLPSGVSFSEGEAHDVTAYDGLMQQRDSDPGAMLADKGYDNDTIRHDLRDSGACRDPEQEQRKSTLLDQQTPSMRCGHGLGVVGRLLGAAHAHPIRQARHQLRGIRLARMHPHLGEVCPQGLSRPVPAGRYRLEPL